MSFPNPFRAFMRWRQAYAATDSGVGIFEIMAVTAAMAFPVFLYDVVKHPDRTDTSFQTDLLRENALAVLGSSGIPDGDATAAMLSLGGSGMLDKQGGDIRDKIFVDNGRSGPPRLLKSGGVEVRVVRKNGEFFVEFHGQIPISCSNVDFAVCL